MDVRTKNELLLRGEIERENMWPYLAEMKAKTVAFRFEFGLDRLPTRPGLIVVRGPRQYGKSTWLEMKLYDTVREFGKGTALYVSGDELADTEAFVQCLIDFSSLYDRNAKVKRLFIDEVTAIPFWEKGIKQVLDQGLLRDVLVVTTGSKAADLRHGSERLPGRKGKLDKSDYIFLPISYRQFYKHCGHELGEKTWIAYLLTGGSPIACNDIYQFARLPEYFIQLIRDWVLGEIIRSGRSRISFSNMMQCLFRWGGAATGYAKLAREAGLANNTLASEYIEQLSDLLCVLPSWPWDPQRKILQPMKPCKFQLINLAMAVAFHPAKLRAIHEFEALTPEDQGMFLEWLIAQELWRRAVLRGADNPEAIGFWTSQEHEIDFVTPDEHLIEVKRGSSGPMEFQWFPKVFPKRDLIVVCKTAFSSKQVLGVTVHDFLLGID